MKPKKENPTKTSKKSYSSPRLFFYGTLEKLAAGGTGSKTEMGQSKNLARRP